MISFVFSVHSEGSMPPGMSNKVKRNVCIILAVLVLSMAACTPPGWRLQGASPMAEKGSMALIAGGRHHHLGKTVAVSSFFLDIAPVTVGEYASCVARGACTPARGSVQVECCNFAYGLERASHPINCVTYEQAVSFCRWRGARLPVASEWRWAAENRWRRTSYPWGRRPFPPRGTCVPLYVENYSTCPVRQGHSTVDGILGMGENVEEWVSLADGLGATMGNPPEPESRALSERERDLSLSVYSPEYTGIRTGIRCARDAE